MAGMLGAKDLHYSQRTVDENELFFCLIWDVIIWEASAFPEFSSFIAVFPYVNQCACVPQGQRSKLPFLFSRSGILAC